MSFMRLGKWSEMLQRLSADFQFEAMYGVVCMYNMLEMSIFGAYAGSMLCVTTEGAGVGAMGQRTRQLAATADIEHEADGLPSFQNEAIAFPVNDDGLINGIGTQSHAFGSFVA